MAFYESVVRANFTYGSLTGVEGFSQEELFLWLPVRDIVIDDPKSGLILFDIGVAQKQLSLSLFEDLPDCNAKSKWISFFCVAEGRGFLWPMECGVQSGRRTCRLRRRAAKRSAEVEARRRAKADSWWTHVTHRTMSLSLWRGE
ncbi:Hypothetical predicted protein [Olea europaea subsp. europaea]|uniref:Uncharacterized protein n=1 Tax=Olea europaea subsp. europaea TaxID=158383 RepID=A0A8S0TWC5_OLEEU|nr:Hypothetical predicted protein [Olea europaea subsp. europaea]